MITSHWQTQHKWMAHVCILNGTLLEGHPHMDKSAHCTTDSMYTYHQIL